MNAPLPADLVAEVRVIAKQLFACAEHEQCDTLRAAADELQRAREQLGALAVLILQNDREEITEWARGVKITFPDGSPMVSL
jgi:hypothetical protein